MYGVGSLDPGLGWGHTASCDPDPSSIGGGSEAADEDFGRHSRRVNLQQWRGSNNRPRPCLRLAGPLIVLTQ